MKPAAASAPEVTEPDLAVVDTDGDDLSEEEREELHRALKAGYVQARTGRVVAGEEVVRKLRSGR